MHILIHRCVQIQNKNLIHRQSAYTHTQITYAQYPHTKKHEKSRKHTHKHTCRYANTYHAHTLDECIYSKYTFSNRVCTCTHIHTRMNTKCNTNYNFSTVLSERHFGICTYHTHAHMRTYKVQQKKKCQNSSLRSPLLHLHHVCYTQVIHAHIPISLIYIHT
jgi:hypothetical protein